MQNKTLISLIMAAWLSCFIMRGQETQALTDTAVALPDTVRLDIDEDFDFFASDDPLQITLRFDIQGFIKNKTSDDKTDATITLALSETDSIYQKIKIQSRGKMRLAYCDFPPIMLNFKSKKDEPASIQNKGKLKLVTHCKDAALYESYLLKEYLVYKLYNIVTPLSFKTRLVKVNYVDVNHPKRNIESYGFLIENDKKMAERNRSVLIGTVVTSQDLTITEDMVRMAVFQYVIGNTDWKVRNQHNVKIIKSLDILTDKVSPVPYDFDYSGFVNTNYSSPADDLPIEYVVERYYTGICATREQFASVIDEFESYQQPFLEAINGFELLKSGYRKQAASYISSYYKMSKNRNYLIGKLESSCRDL